MNMTAVERERKAKEEVARFRIAKGTVYVGDVVFRESAVPDSYWVEVVHHRIGSVEYEKNGAFNGMDAVDYMERYLNETVIGVPFNELEKWATDAMAGEQEAVFNGIVKRMRIYRQENEIPF